jgi:hypothetical protein
MSHLFVQNLKGPFDLSSDRKLEPQYFRMETNYIHFGFNGNRINTETYILKLQYIPDALSGENESQYNCSEFVLKINNEPSFTIPALKNWTYVFNPTLSGTDNRGPLMGIPIDKFKNILDSHGNALPFDIRYAIYNNFIDFHGINDIFARPMKFGKGIQDLKGIGQKIVHLVAFSKAHINFGADTKSGSIFKNGEVTLGLKGVSVVSGVPCALIEYDSGECTFKMIMPFSTDQEVVTEGGSQYKGEIYIDIATRWVRKSTLDEFLITETSIPNSNTKSNGYTVRHVMLDLISLEEFENRLPTS